MAYVKMREIYGGDIRNVSDVKAERLIRHSKAELCDAPVIIPDPPVEKKLKKKVREKVSNADSD